MNETEEQRIQRLVKEGITKAKTDEEWEKKRNIALSGVSWTNMIATSLFLSVLSGMVAPMINLGDAISIGIIVFILMITLLYFARNATIKTYESPETLKDAEDKQKKQQKQLSMVFLLIIIIVIGGYFLFAASRNISYPPAVPPA